MSAARNFFALTCLRARCCNFSLYRSYLNCSRSMSTVQKLPVNPRSERRQTRDDGATRPKKHSQYAQSPKLNKTSNTKKRPPPSRRRQRMTPARSFILPDLGLTAEQLGALAGVSERKILQCAKELDDSAHNVQALLSPALVELVTEELHLNVIFRQQNKPLFPQDEKQALIAGSSETRMPVITVMGHVDHGKTSLLDSLRNSDVVTKEVGGITQSVAAFKVPINTKSGNSQEAIFATFIDTPGHAAFKAMRANGTIGTDIVILVVAADDGVMPQTVEAVKLARSANVPIIVAVNKCDAPGADPERVRYQLLEQLALNTEQLGGEVQCVDISAKTGSNLSLLLEAISLQAELLDLRTRAEAPGHGVCLESRIDKSLGSIATVVVRIGTFRKGDYVVFQSPKSLHEKLYGRVRDLLGSDAAQLDRVGPGHAVGVVGIKEIIPPGAEVRVVSSERAARALSQEMTSRNSAAIETIQSANSLFAEIVAKREAQQQEIKVVEDDIMSSEQRNVEGDGASTSAQTKQRTLVILIKADVKGSADAVAHCIRALGSTELPVRVIAADVGDVNERDIQLAAATNKVKGNNDVCMLIAFNVRIKDSLSRIAQRTGLPILEHSLIYHLEDDVKQRIERIREDHQTTEELLGRASVIRVFENGAIAGCSIENGIISEGDTAKVMRFPDNYATQRVREEVYSGPIQSIKQFAKTVRSVKKGSECGVSLQGWSEFVEGDHIECVSAKT